MAHFCAACGNDFNSLHAFDKHRVGSYGTAILDAKDRTIGYTRPERRCMTIDEMIAAKMQRNQYGRWTGEAFPEELKRKYEGGRNDAQ